MLSQHPIILSKDISAIAIEGTGRGRPQHGAITRIPTGTELRIVGDGFNQRTVRVECNGSAYFVFLQDIEEPDSSYYLPNRLFWNEARECLYDVVNGDTRDASIRPNQVFAVSLPHSLVDQERGRKILWAVEKYLLTPVGLSSLAPSDPAYRPHYGGDVVSRDSAYHQDTVWPWLIGPFITAYMRVHADSPETHQKVRSWLSGFGEHFRTAGLGHISEVADADSPHAPGGCIAQAWRPKSCCAQLQKTFCE
jgi:hypothetical protein